jgi:hypothetical protein
MLLRGGIGYYQTKNKKLLKLDVKKSLDNGASDLAIIKIIVSCYVVLSSDSLMFIVNELIKEKVTSGNQDKLDTLVMWHNALKLDEDFSGTPPELKPSLSKIRELLPNDQLAVDMLVAQLQKHTKKEVYAKNIYRLMWFVGFMFATVQFFI